METSIKYGNCVYHFTAIAGVRSILVNSPRFGRQFEIKTSKFTHTENYQAKANFMQKVGNTGSSEEKNVKGFFSYMDILDVDTLGPKKTSNRKKTILLERNSCDNVYILHSYDCSVAC